jgi:hypothetical protein
MQMPRFDQLGRLVPWLPLPFFVIGAAILASHEFTRHAAQLGNDAHIYYRGAVAWLQGADPWSSSYHGLHFAAPPTVLPILAPFTLLPELRFVEVSIALDVVASFYVVRRSGLSWLWLLFPPLVHGTLNGNPAIVSLALLLAGAGPIGVLLRPQMGYALVGERRWHALGVLAALVIGLIAFLPVRTFLADLPAVAARYTIESGGGSTGGMPLALAIGIISIVALATIDLRAAGWLATIVAFPINGWYAGAAAIPLASPILAVGLALPIVGLPTATIATYVAVRFALRWLPTGRAARVLAPLVAPYRRVDRPSKSAGQSQSELDRPSGAD